MLCQEKISLRRPRKAGALSSTLLIAIAAFAVIGGGLAGCAGSKAELREKYAALEEERAALLKEYGALRKEQADLREEQAASTGGVGRKGVAGIGYGSGYGSGFGVGGSGGVVDDLLGGLMSRSSISAAELRKINAALLEENAAWRERNVALREENVALREENAALREKQAASTGGGRSGGAGIGYGNSNSSGGSGVVAMTGGRSRASIQRVVMQNVAALRYAYNQRLRDKPGLSGQITIKFAIDEFGKVIFAQVAGSTMGDSELEQTLVSQVRGWDFDRINKPGDVTEVTYPFTFAQ